MKRILSSALALSLLAIAAPGQENTRETAANQVKAATQAKTAAGEKAAVQAGVATQERAGNRIQAATQTKNALQEGMDKRGSFDDDGDGIMNCQDSDYSRPKDGTGKKLGKMQGGKGGAGKGGFGITSGGATGGTGTGICDGAGPKGKGRSR